MTIPESQFDTWAKQGATSKAQTAHLSIRRALSQWTGWSTGLRYDDYLQGSYRNYTNIWRDSDVDLVVELTSVARFDTTELNAWDLQQFNTSINWVSYDWADFRQEVLRALYAYYEASRIDPTGKKTIKVGGFDGLYADVVVCMKHYKYRRYPVQSAHDCVEGMTFFVPSEYRWVVNYPKLHIANGEQKNTQNGWYKSTVRIFKNMKRYMVDNRLLGDGVAPSYFLECMLYNVPNSQFGTSYQTTFLSVIDWIAKSNLDQFMCQNGQLELFGASPEQWSSDRAITYLKAALDLYQNWNN
jgi:hypothetical protein